MAFLYRRDLEILGYNIEPRKVKKKSLLSVLAFADLYVDNQVTPCLATFYKIRNGVRIDIILDKDIENQIMNHYISFMKKSPKFFVEVLVRTGIKILSSICGLMACLYILYILITKSSSISCVDLNNIAKMLTCFFLVMVVRILLNII